MTELVFATNNKHKRDEVANMLRDMYHIHTLAEIGIYEDIPENEPTLEGNARQKAKYVFERQHCDVFADDTGLEVEVLDGAPGVYSARYAGDQKDSSANIDKLLSEMKGKENRKARFRTVICLILKGKEYLFEGIAEGTITEEKSGTEGFGYDPVFRPAPPPQSSGGDTGRMPTFAEMSQNEKNRISHRGKAIEQLIAFLKSEKGVLPS